MRDGRGHGSSHANLTTSLTLLLLLSDFLEWQYGALHTQEKKEEARGMLTRQSVEARTHSPDLAQGIHPSHANATLRSSWLLKTDRVVVRLAVECR